MRGTDRRWWTCERQISYRQDAAENRNDKFCSPREQLLGFLWA